MEFFIFLILAGAFALYKFISKAPKPAQHHLKAIGQQLGLRFLDSAAPVLRGHYLARAVQVKEYEYAGTTWTRFRVRFKKPLKTKFKATSTHNSGDSASLVTGDQEFDREVSLIGNEEQVLSLFENNQELRQTVQNLFTATGYQGVSINEEMIDIHIARSFKEPQDVLAVFRDLTFFLNQLEQADSKHSSVKKYRKPPPLPTTEKKSPALELKRKNEWVPTKKVTIPPPPQPAIEPEITPEPEVVIPKTAAIINEEPEEEVIAVKESEHEQPQDTSSGISVADVSEVLLGESTSNYQASKAFDQLLKGEFVTWSGTIESIAAASTERNFNIRTGWVAQCDLGDLLVKYRIAEPKEQGTLIEIKGELSKFDPFSKTLYIESGETSEVTETSSAAATILASSSRSYSSRRYTSYAEKLEKEKASKARQSRYEYHSDS